MQSNRIDLHNADFMQLLGSLASQIVREAYPESADKITVLSPARDLRRDEEYVRRTIRTSSELITVCDQMRYAVEFLSGFRSTRLYKDHKLTRLDYLIYHIESHLIRAGMILDRVLMLVNIVFRLGVPPRECKMAVIARNEHVISTRVADAIGKIDKLLQPIRSQRNIIVHQESYRVDGPMGFEAYYLLEKFQTVDPDPEIERYYFLVKRITDKFVAKKKKELNELNEAIVQEVAALFDALLPHFRKIHHSLKNVTDGT